MKARGRTDTGTRGRTRRPGRIGLVLSVFLICLQVVAPGLHSSLQLDLRTGTGDLSGLLGQHALCLGTTPGSPAGEPSSPVQPPKDHHHDFASCCFWHGNASLRARNIADGSAVSFDIAGFAFLAPTYTVVVPARLSGTFAARAPPARA